MNRSMRMAAFALAATFAMSGLALAQRDRDDDGYYRQGNTAQAQRRGYENGYRDGVSKGRHEGRENDPYDYQTPDWRRATRGYEDWMGPVSWYQRGYQEGYSDGFRAGFESFSRRRGDSDGDRDDRRPYSEWRGPYHFNGGSYGSDVAYRFGYDDGSDMARRDIDKRKSYNPNPRGKFDDKDHGYRREYGSKDQYKAEYTRGYMAGYQSLMGNQY